MEEMSPSVAVTLSVGNSRCDNSGISSSMEITRLKLVTDAASLLSNPSRLVLANDPGGEAATDTLKSSERGDENEMITESRSAVTRECEEEEVLSVGDENNLVIAEELLSMDAGQAAIGLPTSDMIISVEADPVPTQAIVLGDSIEVPKGELITSPGPKVEASGSSTLNSAVFVSQLLKEKSLGKGGVKSVFELDCIPLWGSVSIRGKRSEMEDAVTIVPRFMRIPIKMLVGEHAVDGINPSLTHVTSHFFGVYDGHGGSQVLLICYCYALLIICLVKSS